MCLFAVRGAREQAAAKEGLTMVSDSSTQHDVIIVGGGPVGSTVATLVKKYRPEMSVLIIEKERFPREHVGESQLPSISPILDEMDVWDKVEAAGFPIKIGASYTWGADNDRWDFDFFPVEHWKDEPRPAKYQGQRRYTAFQVERAQYDELLLRHAESVGAEVREEVLVEEILKTGDKIDGFRLSTGETVTGKYYVDGSGAWAILRRAMGVECDAPTELRNIAIWDYWDNADWAVEIGIGGTRVQVRSLPYGWIWFIPLGPTRTSVGLIVPSEYYKASGKTTEELYNQAVSEQPEIAKLIENAKSDGDIKSCKDWSHLAHRLYGENWFIAGEAGGFADPILAAGLSLAHGSAREVAYTIVELERGEHGADWLKQRYNDRTRTNINQHIRFAQFWYSANGCFTDIKEHCQRIAAEGGLRLNPKQAWQWLSQGGFTTEQVGYATFGSFDIASAKQILEKFDDRGRKCQLLIDGHNVFKLNYHGAEECHIGHLADGRIERIKAYRRADTTLPLTGNYAIMVEALEVASDVSEIIDYLKTRLKLGFSAEHRDVAFNACIQTLEVMAQEGWVQISKNKKRPTLHVSTDGSRFIRTSEETEQALRDSDASVKSRI